LRKNEVFWAFLSSLKKEILNAKSALYLVSGILTDEQIEDLILQPASGRKLFGSMASSPGRSGRWKRIGERPYTRACGIKLRRGSARLLLRSPYRASTWELVNQLSAEARNHISGLKWFRNMFLTHLKKTTRAFAACLKSNVLAAFASMHFELEEIIASSL
jgi:hypothetical protein